MNVATAAYLAGLLDGEGCFHLSRFKTKFSSITYQYKPTIEITMCDKRTIDFVAKATGKNVRISKAKSGKPTYIVVWCSQTAINLSKQLLPFLICKKEQAELLIHFHEHVAPGRGRPYQEKHRELCEEAYHRCKALKSVSS